MGVGSHARARGALRDQSGRPSVCPGRRAGGDVGHDSRQKRIELQAIEGRLTLKGQRPIHGRRASGTGENPVRDRLFRGRAGQTETVAGGCPSGSLYQEKPFITEIVFDGNQELSDDKLKEKITIKEPDLSGSATNQESAEKVRLAYQEDGYTTTAR